MSEIRYEGRREASSPSRKRNTGNRPQRRKRYRGKKSKKVILIVLAVCVIGVGSLALFTDIFQKEKSPAIGFTGDQELVSTDTETNSDGDGQQTVVTDTDTSTDLGSDATAVVPSELDYEIVAVKDSRIEATGEVTEHKGVLQIGDSGFEYYTYASSTAEKYASVVNNAAKTLKDKATVYDIVIPLSGGIVMPDDLKGQFSIDDMGEATDNIIKMLDDDVKVVPIYDTLMNHRTEYLYFRTDHHWTALGAYYAYRQFCLTKGITPYAVDSYQTIRFDGFLGTFFSDANKPDAMRSNPDYVLAYYPHSEGATMQVTDSKGETYAMPILYNETNAGAGLKYSTFISGDNPFSVITNPNLTDGSACAVIKESFGNSFVPFLVDHYQTIYVIDYRYWEGSLTELVETNGITDVIFVNNLSAIRNKSLVGSLQALTE